MKPAKVYFVALSLALALLAGASDVMAERIETPGISESSWSYELYVDVWFPAVPATIISDGLEVEIPESVRNIYRAMNISSMMRFKARKGPLGVFLNPIYYNGTWDAELEKFPLTGRGYKLNERVWLVDFGMSYEVTRWEIGKNGTSRELTLEPYAGMRYFRDNITLKVQPGLILDGFKKYINIDTIAPIIGLQSRANLSNSWDVLFVGDYGGFNVGKFDKTYQLATYFEYNFNWGKNKDRSARAFLGYRYLDLELENDTTYVDVVVKGPIVGLGFLF
jgi:hypothetical protein